MLSWPSVCRCSQVSEKPKCLLTTLCSASGHEHPHQSPSFSRISRVRLKFLTPDVRPDIHKDVRRISGPELTLWAALLFVHLGAETAPVLASFLFNQQGLHVCSLWGCHPDPRLGPMPVQVPSWVRRGPIQIRHVLCFTAFRTHPGPEVGAIPARPGPILVPSIPSFRFKYGHVQFG